MIKYLMRSGLFFFILLASMFSSIAEEGIIYYNRLYVQDRDYIIADLEGQGVTWDWVNRSLRFSNSFGKPNDQFEYPRCDDWVIIGPVDLSIADNPVFYLMHKLEYGTNALSVHASSNFPGHIPGSANLAGHWLELLSEEDVNSVPGLNTVTQVDLSELKGDKEVYIGVRYQTSVSGAVSTSSIDEMKVTRNVTEEIREIEPSPELVRSSEGVDYFNLSGTGTTGGWSIRTGYARASGGSDQWLVFRSFDLTSSGDAFFSLSSQLLNGSNGPVGLQIKITRSEFKSGDLVDQFVWEDYSTFGIDHRVNATDYYESGKMDLSAYLGGFVTIAFRYINAVGEQYQIKDFKVFHEPDKTPPIFHQFSINRLTHNKLELRLNANERAELFWGIYPDNYIGRPDADELETGDGAVLYGTFDYDYPFVDSLYIVSGFNPEQQYKMFGMLKDRSENRSVTSLINFNSPAVDKTPPAINEFSFFEIKNNSLKASITFSEQCEIYYLLRATEQGSVDYEMLIDEGADGYFAEDPITLSFINLEKSKEYSLFISAVDFAGNISDIYEQRVITTNADEIPPVFSSFKILSIGNEEINIETNIDEEAHIFYSVQKLNEVPPTIEGIIDGGRAVSFGDLHYAVEGVDITFNVTGLNSGQKYIIYCFAADNSNNRSIIQSLEFQTETKQIPVIKKRYANRIEIEREGTFTIDENYYIVENYDNPEDLDLLIYAGENYKIRGDQITAVDEFTGSISVPIALGKDTTRYSNVIELEVIVDVRTVADSLVAVRRLMLENRTINPLSDKSTPVALLELRSDGSFFDAISSKSPDYTDYMTTVLGGRLISIAKDYHNDKFRRRKKIQVRHQLYSALEYWLDHKPEYRIPETPFQWPQYLGTILLILHDDMVEEYENSSEYRVQIERLRNKADAFNMWCWHGSPEEPFFQPFEGNNLTRRIWGSFAIAAALEQPQTAFMIRDMLFNKLELQYNGDIDKPAGLAPDGSYTMNNFSGAQWNWIAYGASFMNHVLDYAEFTRRTPWRLPYEKFQLLGDALTGGAAWLYWRDFVPYNLLSRQSTRNGQTKTKATYRTLMNRIRYESFVNNYQLENNFEITELYKRMGNEYTSIDSTKYFWNSNIMIHSRPLYFSSLVMPSVRTGNLEADVDTLAGLKNFFMGDGTLLTMVNENSYYQRNVFNYKKLPGTTLSYREVDLPVNYGGLNGKSLNKFAGGVSNGRIGVSSFYYDKENNVGDILGQKSYFFFEKGIVALGSGIRKKSVNKQNTVYTIIEQDLLSAEIKHKIGSDQFSSIDKGTTTYSRSYNLNRPALIYSGSKGYLILPEEGGAKLNVTIQEQTGAWDEINGTWRNQRNNPNYVMSFTTAPVLTMEIDHGKEPSNAKYGYMIFPGHTEKNFISMAESMMIRVIENSDSVQAVTDSDKAFGIVFIKACKLQLTPQIAVEVDKPVILLMEVKENGRIDILASDPFQKEILANIIITITNPNENPYHIQRIISFPQDKLKGKAAFTSTGDVWELIPKLPEEKSAQYYLSDDQITVVDIETDNLSAQKFDFDVYPNPLGSDQNLNIRYLLDKYENIEIKLVTTEGKIIYMKESYSGPGIYEGQILSRHLSPGVYILTVVSGDKSGSKIILIN